MLIDVFSEGNMKSRNAFVILLSYYFAVLPCMLEAINRNGLFYFLLLNLQTGLVNLNVRTVHTGDVPATGILTLHLLTLSISAALLDYRNLTLKFW